MGAHLDRLPVPQDGEAGLDRLRELFGDRNLFQHIRWIRDHTTKPDVVNRTMERLAAAVMTHVEAGRPKPTYDAARQATAARLGFEGTARPNLYHRYLDPGAVKVKGEKPLKWVAAPPAGERRYLAALPIAADGEDGLRALVDAFGTEAVFQYLRYLRDARPQAPTVSRFVQRLAVRMLHDLQAEDPALAGDERAAKQKLAELLGYSKTGRVYLYALIRAGHELLADHYA